MFIVYTTVTVTPSFSRKYEHKYLNTMSVIVMRKNRLYQWIPNDISCFTDKIAAVGRKDLCSICFWETTQHFLTRYTWIILLYYCILVLYIQNLFSIVFAFFRQTLFCCIFLDFLRKRTIFLTEFD